MSPLLKIISLQWEGRDAYNFSISNLPKTKKFGCVDRGDLTLLFFSKVVKKMKVRGDLSTKVEDNKSFKKLTISPVRNNATALIWYLENRFDVLIN